MNKPAEFLQTIAAMLAAGAIIFGAIGGLYFALDEEFRLATEGWVREKFEPSNNFTTLTTANININYYEKKKCENVLLDETAYEILEDSYLFYAQIKMRPHRYRSGVMSAAEICAERGVPDGDDD